MMSLRRTAPAEVVCLGLGFAIPVGLEVLELAFVMVSNAGVGEDVTLGVGAGVEPVSE